MAVSPYLAGTEQQRDSVARLSYTHDAMIDLILSNPALSRQEIAAAFGYKAPWVGRVIGSDAFQGRLAERKAQLLDPGILASVEERLRSCAMRSLDVVMEKLDSPGVKDETALKALDLTTKALGFGARQQSVNVQTNFVVAMPGVTESATDWAAAYKPQVSGLAAAARGACAQPPGRMEIEVPAIPPGVMVLAEAEDPSNG